MATDHRKLTKLALRHASEATKDISVVIFKIFAFLLEAAEKNRYIGPIFKFLKRTLIITLYTLSPALHSRPVISRLTRNIVVLILGLVIGYFVSYTLNSWAADISGTLYGNDRTIFYFNDDDFNREIYKVWAPLYMGFSIIVIFLSALYWGQLHDFAENHGSAEISYNRGLRSFAAFLIIALITTIFLQRYFYNLPTETADHKLFWFYSRTGQGVAKFNFAGVIYITTIFLKLFVLFIALACYISIAIEWTRLMVGLSKKSRLSKEEHDAYVDSVIACNRIYFYFLCLFIVLIFHNQVWSKSYIGDRGVNVYLVATFLLLIFLFLMAIPRIYAKIEYGKRDKYRAVLESLDENSEYIFLRFMIILAYALIYTKILWPLVQFIAGSQPGTILEIIPETIRNILDSWISLGKISRA